jgi:hypothetical protein
MNPFIAFLICIICIIASIYLLNKLYSYLLEFIRLCKILKNSSKRIQGKKMYYPLSELIDRLTIVYLKIENYPEEKEKLLVEKAAYREAIIDYSQVNISKVDKWIKDLYVINKRIWDLEYKLRRGELEEFTLEEVGKTAIEIRKINGERVRLKGEIVEATKSGFKDIKVNHVSETTQN